MMNWTRREIIDEYNRLCETGLSNVEDYYAIERPLVAALEGLVVLLDDGETCIYTYDSGIATARLLK